MAGIKWDMYSLLLETLGAVLQPWVGTIRAVLTKLHPLAAHLTEHTVRLDLCKQRVGTQRRGTLVGVPSAGLLCSGEIARGVVFERRSERSC